MKFTHLALLLALVSPALARTGERVLVRSKAPIVALAYAPDGKTLASADREHRVTLTAVNSGKITQSFGYKSAVKSLAYAPDGKLLAIGVGREVRLLDTRSDMKTAAPVRVLRAPTDIGATLQFSANGRTLLAVEGDYNRELSDYENRSTLYAVSIWDVKSGKLARRHGEKQTDTYAAALAPDGTRFASFGEKGALSLFSVESGAKIRDLSDTFPDNRGNTGLYVAALAFSPDGKWVAGTGGYMESVGNLVVWEVASGTAKWNHIFPDWASSVAWANDGSRVAVGTSYNTIYDDPGKLHRPSGAPIWSANGEWQRSIQRAPGEINALAWSPNGKTLATGAEDGAVRLWAVG